MSENIQFRQDNQDRAVYLLMDFKLGGTRGAHPLVRRNNKSHWIKVGNFKEWKSPLFGIIWFIQWLSCLLGIDEILSAVVKRASITEVLRWSDVVLKSMIFDASFNIILQINLGRIRVHLLNKIWKVRLNIILHMLGYYKNSI